MAISKKKILIVEDNTLNLKLFRDVLRAKGFETIEDRTGRYCLEYAILHKPDLIILDILLPFASGIELTQQLSTHTQTKSIPILGVTALAISGTLDQMIESGCVNCLIKPFTLDQFIHGVDQAIVVDHPISTSKTHSKSRQSVDHIEADPARIQSVNMTADRHRMKMIQKSALNQNEKNQDDQSAENGGDDDINYEGSARLSFQGTLF